jgi:hypothetical protein
MSAPVLQFQCPYGCELWFGEKHVKCKGVMLPRDKVIDLSKGQLGGLPADYKNHMRVKPTDESASSSASSRTRVSNLVYWEVEQPDTWWKDLLQLKNAVVLHTHPEWERRLLEILIQNKVPHVFKVDDDRNVKQFDVIGHCAIRNVEHLYGIREVRAFEHCEQVLIELTAQKYKAGMKLRNKWSIAQLGYDWWEKTCPVKWEALKGEQFAFAKLAAYGARSACTVGKWESSIAAEIEKNDIKYEDLVGDPEADVRYQLDSNSMYPAMMHGVPGMPTTYPVGPTQMLKDPAQAENAFRSGKAGLYEVRYTRPVGLPIGILPRYISKGKLIWDATPGVAQGVFTAVDLETAEQYGYQLEFLGKAVIWESKSDNLFRGYVSKLYETKSTTTDKNVRGMVKAMLNRLYGKLAQQDKGKLIERQPISVEKALERMQADEFIEWDDNGRCYMPSEVASPGENVFPNHLASYVLAWSRRYMLQMMAVINYRFDFSHTDCLRVSSADYEKLEEAGYVDETKLGRCKIDHGGLIFRSEQAHKNKYTLWVLTKENQVAMVIKGK